MSTSIAEAPNGLTSFIERAAKDEGFSVEKFEALLRLQQEVAREHARQEFNAAMSQVVAEIGPVIRDRLNPAVNRKYATLEAIDAVARPVYSRHGFAIRFGSDKPAKEGWIRVTCTVSHSGGYSEQNYLDSPVDIQQGNRARTPVQAVGSTITYLRRYLLQMSLNIVLADDETDDDGESLRAVAAATQRAPRIAERAAAYEAPQTPVQRVTLRQWLDEFEQRCASAQTQEEGDHILREEAVLRLDDPALQINEGARSRALAARSAMVKRLWPEPPEDETEPEVEIAGAEKLAAG